MKKAFVWALTAISLLLVFTGAAWAAPLAPDYTKVGVKVGDVAIYRYSSGLPQNKTRLLVYGIVGSLVTFNYTLYNPDGSVASYGQPTIDVVTGAGAYYFLIAANLTTSDPVYSGWPIAINETTQMVVAGALRTVNHIICLGGSLNAYWDRATGLMTELHLGPPPASQAIESSRDEHHSERVLLWQNYTLLSTTAWSPDTVPSLFNMTTIALIEGVVIIVLVIVLIVLASRRRGR
jgi:hypothetical protein